jgi:Methylamine utilisation protein MauE
MDAMGHDLLAIVAVAGRVCVGLVFVLAAAQKASHWRILSGVIANYRLLPRAMVVPAVALLPPLEMIVGVLLLCAVAMPGILLAAITLLAVFAVAMAINLRRGRSDIDCGCGQSFLKQTLSWTLVARNAVLAALLLPSLAMTGAMNLSAVLTGMGAGLAFFLLYLLLNALSALPRPGARGHRFA